MIAEDQRDRSAEVCRFLGWHKDVERPRRCEAAGAILAAHEHVEPGDRPAVDCLECRTQADVLGLEMDAVLGAAGDGDVELARQVRELAVSDESLGEAPRDWRSIE